MSSQAPRRMHIVKCPAMTKKKKKSDQGEILQGASERTSEPGSSSHFEKMGPESFLKDSPLIPLLPPVIAGCQAAS